jgi:hypothetical protein
MVFGTLGLRVPTHRSTVGKAPSLLEAGSECSPRPKGARPKLRPSGRTIKYADLGYKYADLDYLSRFGGKTTRPSLGQTFAPSQVHIGGGIWTHFPDRVTYRLTEVRRLEPT